jgi:hypothetical protein
MPGESPDAHELAPRFRSDDEVYLLGQRLLDVIKLWRQFASNCIQQSSTQQNRTRLLIRRYSLGIGPAFLLCFRLPGRLPYPELTSFYCNHCYTLVSRVVAGFLWSERSKKIAGEVLPSVGRSFVRKQDLG